MSRIELERFRAHIVLHHAGVFKLNCLKSTVVKRGIVSSLHATMSGMTYDIIHSARTAKEFKVAHSTYLQRVGPISVSDKTISQIVLA